MEAVNSSYEDHTEETKPDCSKGNEADYFYKAIPIKERLPDLIEYMHRKLILLDEWYDVTRILQVGAMMEWESVVGDAEYWLEKTENNSSQQ